jgi:hypothetical protein
MVRLTIGGSGVAAFDRILGIAEEVVGDMRPIWDAVVRPFVFEHMKLQFDTLGAHGGEPWESLDNEPKYKAYKKALLGESLANKVLWWDENGARLRPSLVEPGHQDQVYISSPKKFQFGTRVEHTGSLIEGGIGPFGEKYPGRNIFRISQSDRKRLVTLIQRAIIDQVEGRGFSRSMMRDQF